MCEREGNAQTLCARKGGNNFPNTRIDCPEPKRRVAPLMPNCYLGLSARGLIELVLNSVGRKMG